MIHSVDDEISVTVCKEVLNPRTKKGVSDPIDQWQRVCYTGNTKIRNILLLQRCSCFFIEKRPDVISFVRHKKTDRRRRQTLTNNEVNKQIIDSRSSETFQLKSIDKRNRIDDNGGNSCFRVPVVLITTSSIRIWRRCIFSQVAFSCSTTRELLSFMINT